MYKWVERERIVDAHRWTTKRSRSSRSLKLAANDRGSGGLNSNSVPFYPPFDHRFAAESGVVSPAEKPLSRLFPFFVYPLSRTEMEKRVLSQVNRNRYRHHRRFYQYQRPTRERERDRDPRNVDATRRREEEEERMCVRACSRMDEGAFFGSTRSNVDFYRVFTAHRRITCPTCAKNIPIRERSHPLYLPGRKHFLTRNPDCPFISAIFLDGYLLFSLFFFLLFSSSSFSKHDRG